MTATARKYPCSIDPTERLEVDSSMSDMVRFDAVTDVGTSQIYLDAYDVHMLLQQLGAWQTRIRT